MTVGESEIRMSLPDDPRRDVIELPRQRCAAPLPWPPPRSTTRTRSPASAARWRSGSGPRMQEVRDVIEQAARVDVTVLVTGETGTGRSWWRGRSTTWAPAATAPSSRSTARRCRGSCSRASCSATSAAPSPGAHQLKIGKFEAANHGTIFLDEIGDLHPALQGKLLHVLQDGQFSRVGGRSTIKVDVRVLAATNQNLEQRRGRRPVPRGPLLPPERRPDRRARPSASAPRRSRSWPSTSSSATRSSSSARASRCRPRRWSA